MKIEKSGKEEEECVLKKMRKLETEEEEGF